ncbi:hypothetical protein TTHERM_000370959 (macronuclear) [Tetrahymena thermophila SB210]|uniref:Uncharacterized protein n=1 Tax=Tetrahymena thermophila (strain SB210) TaxID=312017 RepID=W7XLB9_TETTS|nr:hypothetical protein TTHERM_000370959 [Tetrahymena thermophila SB210]EWS76019.1 hypothetical protein TTHERM_000370959 [Tetrahymena thermophila SB210]|eukprot:XP_012651457.1 hypothetical protein TTHERM_000370959 [Tetrahymena thermophila SB210]
MSNSVIYLGYRCQGVDVYKTTIPDNCAEPNNIDKIINNPSAAFQVKLQTSQYNMPPSKWKQTLEITILTYQEITLNVTNQQAIIKQGSIFKYDSTFSSPIQHSFEVMTERLLSKIRININHASYFIA